MWRQPGLIQAEQRSLCRMTLFVAPVSIIAGTTTGGGMGVLAARTAFSTALPIATRSSTTGPSLWRLGISMVKEGIHSPKW
jgi:hypothetical protein